MAGHRGVECRQVIGRSLDGFAESRGTEDPRCQHRMIRSPRTGLGCDYLLMKGAEIVGQVTNQDRHVEGPLDPHVGQGGQIATSARRRSVTEVGPGTGGAGRVGRHRGHVDHPLGTTIRVVELLDRLRDAAPGVLADEEIVFAYLFGSQVRGGAVADSDIDVAVLVGSGSDRETPQPVATAIRLAGRLERKLATGPIEVVVLNGAPLPLAGRVVAEGRPFYSTDEPRRVGYESLIFRQFADFDLMATALDRDLIRAHAEGRR